MSKQAAAITDVLLAVAEVIRQAGQIPSGHLYAHLMGALNIQTYDAIIDSLIRARLVKRDGSHLLTWIGPKLES